MTVFDLIFLAVFLSSAGLLVAALIAALGARGRRTAGLLGVVAGLVGVYLAAVVGVSLASPGRTVAVGELRCFDDWCIGVERVERVAEGEGVAWAVTLRLQSRARGRAQRENGVYVYVLDARGRRYEPLAEPGAAPLDVLLQPGESVLTVRRFLLPADAASPGLVVGHGRFPGMFILGDDQSLFHRPSVVPLS